MIRPILLPDSVNQRLPSGPAAIPRRGGSRVANSSIVPAGVIRPTRLSSWSVNQTLPSAPAAIPRGLLSVAVSFGNSLIAPAGVICPILLSPESVNQRLPSGPAAIRDGVFEWWCCSGTR